MVRPLHGPNPLHCLHDMPPLFHDPAIFNGLSPSWPVHRMTFPLHYLHDFRFLWLVHFMAYLLHDFPSPWFPCSMTCHLHETSPLWPAISMTCCWHVDPSCVVFIFQLILLVMTENDLSIRPLGFTVKGEGSVLGYLLQTTSLVTKRCVHGGMEITGT